MNCNFYYRTPKKKLHCLHVKDAGSVDEARQLVMELLYDEAEVFLKPLLGVIQGGKQ